MTVPPNTNLDPGAPFSQEAEESTIGSVLIDPIAYMQLSAFLKASDFFLLRHQYIWQGFERLNNRSEPIDPITLGEELENMGVLDNIGGRAYLIHLLNNTGTSVYAEVYGRLVERTSIRRQLMMLADTINKDAKDESGIAFDVITQSLQTLMNLQIKGNGMELIPISDSVSAHMDTFEKRRQNPDFVTGIRTEYDLFDYITAGLQPERLYVVGGVTGMGKSAFMLNIALRVAKQKIILRPIARDKTCYIAWFTYENTVEETNTRMIGSLGSIELKRIESGATDNKPGPHGAPSETQRYFDTAGKLANLNIHLNENADLTVSQIRAMCRKLKFAGQLDAVFVDYLQIVPSGMKFNNRHEEIGYISGELKKLAKELKVPVMTAAQLNRESFSTGRPPKLSDLRESGKIEQDSDAVILLHSDDYPWGRDWDEAVKDNWHLKVHIAKHRNGKTGICDFMFKRPMMQINEFIPDKFVNSSNSNTVQSSQYADEL